VRHEIALLVNPAAGGGRGARLVAPVVGRLERAGLHVRRLGGASGLEAEELARKAVADGTDALVALGGDGLVHLALQAVAGTRVPLGIIPAGTGNDIARAVGVPLADPLAAADIVAAGHTQAIDAGRSGSRWFAGVVGAGFDSAVNERANRMSRLSGRYKYDLAILTVLRTFQPIPFTLELDGETWQTRAMLVAVGNGRSYGGGMLVTPDAKLDDGLLDVLVLGPLSRRAFVRVFPRVYRGTHVTHPAVTVRRARVVSLAAVGVVAYADGERFGQLPLTCTAMPGAVHVLVPAPAAHA
jgi:diacylglycerol kinase (ATP)